MKVQFTNIRLLSQESDKLPNTTTKIERQQVRQIFCREPFLNFGASVQYYKRLEAAPISVLKLGLFWPQNWIGKT